MNLDTYYTIEYQTEINGRRSTHTYCDLINNPVNAQRWATFTAAEEAVGKLLNNNPDIVSATIREWGSKVLNTYINQDLEFLKARDKVREIFLGIANLKTRARLIQYLNSTAEYSAVLK